MRPWVGAVHDAVKRLFTSTVNILIMLNVLILAVMIIVAYGERRAQLRTGDVLAQYQEGYTQVEHDLGACRAEQRRLEAVLETSEALRGTCVPDIQRLCDASLNPRSASVPEVQEAWTILCAEWEE